MRPLRGANVPTKHVRKAKYTISFFFKTNRGNTGKEKIWSAGASSDVSRWADQWRPTWDSSSPPGSAPKWTLGKINGLVDQIGVKQRWTHNVLGLRRHRLQKVSSELVSWINGVQSGTAREEECQLTEGDIAGGQPELTSSGSQPMFFLDGSSEIIGCQLEFSRFPCARVPRTVDSDLGQGGTSVLRAGTLPRLPSHLHKLTYSKDI